MLSIDPSTLTDNCTINTTKQIWDVYTTQYKEKDFVLWFTLFTHLVTTKVEVFKSITAYNADFQITMDKLSSLGETLPTNLKPAAYLHGIKDTYPDFTANNRSAPCIKVLEISTVIAELEDEGRQARSAEPTALTIWTKDRIKKGDRHTQGSAQAGRGKGVTSTSRPKRSKKKSHSDSTSHNKDSYWKKHPDCVLS